MGRTDDVINAAGHRLSAGAIEEVLPRHPAALTEVGEALRDAGFGAAARESDGRSRRGHGPDSGTA